MVLETQKEQMYTVDDICEIFKIGKNNAYKLLKSGDIPVIKIGKQYRVPIAAFNNWLQTFE